MKTPDEIAWMVESLRPTNISGSLQIWGQWFGRPMDNIHTLVKCQANSDQLILLFDEGETLTLWSPSGLVTSNNTSLEITSAVRVRWEWNLYGQEKSTDNRKFIDYVSDGMHVRSTTNAMNSTNGQASLTAPAIHIN